MQIRFQRFNQRIQPGVEHGAVVHVHHLVTAPLEKARFDGLVPLLDRNDGSVAVPQYRLCGANWIHLAIQPSHPAQGVLQLLLFPLALGLILPMQKAAATTLASKDADRIAAFRA